MRPMRKFMLVAGMLLAVGACGKNKIDKVISDEEGFRDKMCACKDKACADAVHKDFKDWQSKTELSEEDEKKATEDQKKKFDDVNHAMRECRHKFDAPEPPPAPPTPPPAPAGSDTGSAGSAAPAGSGSAG